MVEEEKTEEIEEPKEEVKEEKVEEEKESVEELEEEKIKELVKSRPTISIPEGWVPKTKLGKKVFSGELTDIKKVFAEGMKIAEPPIVDVLLPKLENEIILVGGSTGKGGGIRRTPFRRTTRMHRSGRRYKISVMTVVGNKDGYIGLGLASGPMGKNREVMNKSLNRSKLNLIPVLRGCGSWECGCGTHHSIPFTVEGKSGSVKVKLMPAPKGVGLVVSDEIKKIMRLAGISDIWCSTRGNTHMRINLVIAVFNALKKINTYKLKSEFEEKVGMKVGKVE